MKKIPESRWRLSPVTIAVGVVLACLFFRRGAYFFERAALELRYAWWLVLILGAGGWLVYTLAKNRRQ